MRYKIISTGSKGNAVVINDVVLIDCGVSFKALSQVYKDLKIVLLTHIHSDHFNKTTIRQLAQARPTLRFACCEWLVPELSGCGVPYRNIDVLKIGVKYDYKEFQVSPIKLYHNVPQCGYRLYFGEKKAIYATDTSTLEGISAVGYDFFFIESNYTDEDLRERIAKKEAAGASYIYEYSVANRHLSKEQCDSFFLENMRDGSELIYLHQHEDR